MPHFITETCIGCTICARKCPVQCIAGDNKALHVIDPEICIDCGVCGIYCPVNAIEDNQGTIVEHIKPKQIPKAEVIIEKCTGCTFCVDICPEDCISMENNEDDFFPIAVVDEKKCVSCKLCETVCIKDAIVVDRETPDLRTGMAEGMGLADLVETAKEEEEESASATA